MHHKNRFQWLLTALVFAAALLYGELLMRRTAGTLSSLTIYPLLLIPSEAFILTLFSGWAREKGNRIINCILLAVLAVYYAVQFVYYKQFGSFVSVTMAGMGMDAVTNFSWALMDNIRANFGGILLLFLPTALYIIFCIVKKPQLERYSLPRHGLCLVLAVVLWIGGVQLMRLGGTGNYTPWKAYHDPYTDTDTASRQLGVLATTLVESESTLFGSGTESGTSQLVSAGTAPEDETGTPETAQEVTWSTAPNILKAIDFTKLKEKAAYWGYGASELCDYFAAETGSNKNQYTGLFEGKNLILICAESFSTAALDPDLTPTLYQMANSGIVFDNYYNSFKNTTTNGEFALLAGLYPDVSRVADRGSGVGSMSSSAVCYMPYGLGNIFENLDGTQSFAYHGYDGEYYGRIYSHPNLGYTCRFIEDGMTFSSIWPTSDLELMEQTVDDYIGLDRFNVYYMSFSGHGTYTPTNAMAVKNLDYVESVVGDKGYTETELCYLAGNYELEKAVEYLVERLDEAGKLEDTVICISGDHFPYGLTTDEYCDLMGQDLTTDFELMKDTCILWNSEIEDPIVCDTYCCNVDILPTLLNLFGISFDSRMLSGTDVFADNGTHVAMLYNKSFITDKVAFDATDGTAVWSDAAADSSDAWKQEYLDYMTDYTTSRYTAALNIISGNFYNFVWTYSGLK